MPSTTAATYSQLTFAYVFLFSSEVCTLKEIRRCHAGQNSSEKPSDARRKDEAEREGCCAPRRHAIRAGNQLADSALDSTAARFLLHFTCAGAANVIHKRRAQNAGDSVLRHDAAQFMGGYSQQRQIKQTESLRQPLLCDCSTRQHCHTRNVKSEQCRVLRKQLLLALLFFWCPFSVFLD
jgi:hypothetical protein